MKRSGFSMIELVFVIVILGVLAAVAVPRFVTTRTDAQVAMIRSDIASILKQVPAKVFAANLNVTSQGQGGSTYDGFKHDNVCQKADGTDNGKCTNWGDWIILVSGLDAGRWKSNDNGIVALSGGSKVANVNPVGCGTLIKIATAPGQTQSNSSYEVGDLVFDVLNEDVGSGIDKANPNNNQFCKGLRESYPSGSKDKIVPLTTSRGVSWS